MSLIEKMKTQINKTGGNKGKIFYVKKESKRKVRFLIELDKGISVKFHDSFVKGIDAVCLETFGKKCPLCGKEELRTRDKFVWPVWDLDQQEVKIFMYPMNNCSPLPNIISFYETYGTILDRAYVIERKGEGTNTSYPVIPMDKSRLKSKIKIPSKKAMLSVIGKAFPINEDNLTSNDFEDVSEDIEGMDDGGFADIEDDDIDHPFGENPDEEMDLDDDFDFIDDEVEDINPYEDMAPKQLYLECMKKGIEVPKKKPKKYYIKKLEDYEDDEW